MSPIRTRRLVMRRWEDDDRVPFAAMNCDPEVMEYFVTTLDRDESDRAMERIESHFALHNFGLWALELVATGEFIGFTGLAVPLFDAPFTPTVEVGWRLCRKAWGNGYATEAALAALVIGFRHFALSEIVSFTSVENLRSRAVMRRIGMTHDPMDDFDHPMIPVGHRWGRHVLYRISAASWSQRNSHELRDFIG